LGGQYEDTIEKPKGVKGASGTLGSIRFHKAPDGEIHFHDDDAKLKVAMPAHVWSAAWDGLQSGEHPTFGYIDPDNKTALTVKLEAAGGSVELVVEIDKVKFGKGYEKLQKFSEAL
jgi:hypothetical protein